MKYLTLNVLFEDILEAQKDNPFDSSRVIGADPISKAFRRQYCLYVRTSPVGGRFQVYGKDSLELAPHPAIGKYLQDYWAGKDVGPRTFRVKISDMGKLYL